MSEKTPNAQTQAAMTEARAMAKNRDFKETVTARVQKGPAFAQALLNEDITLFVNGEPESAKLIPRDLVNATIGFEVLALGNSQGLHADDLQLAGSRYDSGRKLGL